MANNPILFNAAIAGATGGIHERWITDENSSGYIAVRNQILIIATEIDAAIPIDANTSINDGQLLQSIVQGVLADRYLLNITTQGIANIADSISALYAALRVIEIPGLNFPISSDDVINDSTVPGATVTDALDDIQDTLEQVSSTTIPTGTTVFNVAADLPAGNNFDFILDGPGGGGASGMVQLGGNSVGGSGGGAGARCIGTFTRTSLIAALPITITLPLGGDGADAVTSAINTAGLTGANGGNGVGASVIGTGLSMFAGSGAGAQGTTAIATNRAGGGGGGWHGNAPATGSGADTTGAAPRPVLVADANKDASNGYGGAGCSQTGSSAGGNSIYGGAAGGTASQQTAVANGGAGGSSTYASGGGGGGGSLSGAGVRSNGGAGGTSGPSSTGIIAGGGGGAGVGAGVAGTNGIPSTATCGATGGGGGAAGVLNGSGGNGGNGGDGGGGGGGGGSVRTSGTSTSGAGGNGGNAKLIIIGRL